MFLDGGERFTHSRSETRRHLAECAQDLFFPCRLGLLVGEDVARRAVLRAQAEDVLTAERRDRSFQDGGAGGPDAHAPRNVGSQSRIRRLVHQRQRSPDAFVGDEAEERRLLELHRESLSERLVEHRVARRVGELGEHDRVLVGERRRTAAIDHARDRGGDDDCGRADREPPRAATPEQPLLRRRRQRRLRRVSDVGDRCAGRRRADSEVRTPSPGTSRRCAPTPATPRRAAGRPAGAACP